MLGTSPPQALPIAMAVSVLLAIAAARPGQPNRPVTIRAVAVDSVVDGVPYSRTFIDLSPVMVQIDDLEGQRSTA
jgi:hypothetical protein